MTEQSPAALHIPRKKRIRRESIKNPLLRVLASKRWCEVGDWLDTVLDSKETKDVDQESFLQLFDFVAYHNTQKCRELVIPKMWNLACLRWPEHALFYNVLCDIHVHCNTNIVWNYNGQMRMGNLDVPHLLSTLKKWICTKPFIDPLLANQPRGKWTTSVDHAALVEEQGQPLILFGLFTSCVFATKHEDYFETEIPSWFAARDNSHHERVPTARVLTNWDRMQLRFPKHKIPYFDDRHSLLPLLGFKVAWSSLVGLFFPFDPRREYSHGEHAQQFCETSHHRMLQRKQDLTTRPDIKRWMDLYFHVKYPIEIWQVVELLQAVFGYDYIMSKSLTVFCHHCPVQPRPLFYAGPNVSLCATIKQFEKERFAYRVRHVQSLLNEELPVDLTALVLMYEMEKE